MAALPLSIKTAVLQYCKRLQERAYLL
jgi:hypothetical protein